MTTANSRIHSGGRNTPDGRLRTFSVVSVADGPSALPAFRHPALFYGCEEEYLAGTVPFVLSALEAGDPVAVAVPAPRLELLRAALGPAAVRRVPLIDMGEAGRNPGRIIPGVLRAFADRHPGRHVHIIGEPIWAGRTETEYPACAQHEALINLAFAGRDATILCPYDVSALDRRALDDAAATHPVVTDGTVTRRSPAYAPERVLAACNQRFPEPPAKPAAALAGLVFRKADLDRLRGMAAEHAARLGLAGPRVAGLEVAVHEVAANSVVHAGGTGRLRIWAEDGQVVCEVTDSGRLTDPLAGRRPAGLSTNGGRGLLLANHLADLLRTHTSPEGTTIRLYWRLPGR